jgi:O-6-methylguanine DNA methyltransferase
MKIEINPRLFVRASESGVTEIGLGKKRNGEKGGSSARTGSSHAARWTRAARQELTAYFKGRARSFSTPCDIASLPRFTRAVLKITARIPYGEVRSYRWVAKKLGRPKATRAVGNALGRNPIPIVIPCHRVVRSDGSLGGYALGLSLKRRLLSLEKCALANQPGSGRR